MAITLRGNADSDFSNGIDIDGTDIELNDDGTANFTGNVDIGGGDIELNADGSADFAGGINRITAAGVQFMNFPSGATDAFLIQEDSTTTHVIQADGTVRIGPAATPTIRLNADGSGFIKDITDDGDVNSGSTAIGFRLHENGFLNIRKTGGTGDCISVFGNGGNKRVELKADGSCSNASGGSWGQISSERRLKQNLELLDPVAAWETVKTLPYYSYQFISDPEKICYGPVVDECPADMQVTVYEENEDGQQVVRADAEGPLKTYDNLLRDARLFVALQEALKRIETLESRLSTLEGGSN